MTVPTVWLVLVVCIVAGLGVAVCVHWLLDRFVMPFVHERIYRRYVRDIERINAEYGVEYEPLPKSHFVPDYGEDAS